MSKSFVANLADGKQRHVADMGNVRAADFHQVTRMVEHATGLKNGLGDDNGSDEYEIDGEMWVAFFTEFWRRGCNGYLVDWAGCAAGIVENITMQPYSWQDSLGHKMTTSRNSVRGDLHHRAEVGARRRNDCAFRRPKARGKYLKYLPRALRRALAA
jgi:hypothetical protein